MRLDTNILRLLCTVILEQEHGAELRLIDEQIWDYGPECTRKLINKRNLTTSAQWTSAKEIKKSRQSMVGFLKSWVDTLD